MKTISGLHSYQYQIQASQTIFLKETTMTLGWKVKRLSFKCIAETGGSQHHLWNVLGKKQTSKQTNLIRPIYRKHRGWRNMTNNNTGCTRQGQDWKLYRTMNDWVPSTNYWDEETVGLLEIKRNGRDIIQCCVWNLFKTNKQKCMKRHFSLSENWY